MRPTLACPHVGKGAKYLMIQSKKNILRGKKSHQPFSKWSLELSHQYLWMEMGYMDTYKPPLYRHTRIISISCSLGQEPCSFMHAIQICNFRLLYKWDHFTVSIAVWGHCTASIAAWDHCTASRDHCTVSRPLYCIYSCMRPLYCIYSCMRSLYCM